MAPPVLLYLPNLKVTAKNTSERLALLLAIKATTLRAGTYVAEPLPGKLNRLTDGRRITKNGGGPLLDVYTADYRVNLKLKDVAGTGVGAAVRRAALGAWYFLRTFAIVLRASRRAKKAIAKWQLLLGFGAVVILLLSLVFTVLAALAAVGVWREPIISGNAGDGVALGLTAFTTWFFFKVRPAVREAAAGLEQLLEYAQHERHAAGVAAVLAEALDEVLEADPAREVHLVGYSLGALVATDFLCPRTSLHPVLDERLPKAIRSLTTIGLPVDLVRLYLPHYLDERTARVPGLTWTNIYIAADVLGSNMIDGEDIKPVPPGGPPVSAVAIGGLQPVSKRYTNEELSVWNIWTRKGFIQHDGYWDEPEQENCLHILLEQVAP